MEGYVYVLVNPSFPNLVKIGKTVNDPYDRANQLDSTGVPTPFIVVFAKKFENCHNAERSAHEYFKERRSRRNREFFEINTTQAIAIIQELGGAIEDKVSLGVGEQYFFLYLAKFGFLRRIGLLKATTESDTEKPAKKDVELLERNLRDYYDWGSSIDDITFDILCRPLEDYREPIEKIIIAKIKEELPKSSKIHEDCDDQTLIKINKFPSLADTYSSDVRDLYADLLDCLSTFVADSDIDTKFQRKRRMNMKGNF
jgi:hypothetical protein